MLEIATETEIFRQLLRIETITGAPESVFAEYDEAFEGCFPGLHDRLKKRTLPGGSLLYQWVGSNSALSKNPLLVMAHFDVVGVDVDDEDLDDSDILEDGWGGHDPFGADIVDVDGKQTIIARGAVDDKASQVAVSLAVERLVKAGFQPERDVYLFFSNDEETTGASAEALAEEFRRTGIRPALILDEGGAVSNDIFDDLKGPVAAVGIGENGMLTLKLTVRGKGHGHSSAPSSDAAPMLLAAAVCKLQGHIFPAQLDPTPERTGSRMLRHASDAMEDGVMKWVYKHARPLRRIITPVMVQKPETAALVRTTVAVTQMEAKSPAFNATAKRGHAIVNLRIAPGSSIAETISIVQAVVGNDVVITRVETANEPTGLTSIRGQAAKWLRAAIEQFYPGVKLMPYVARSGANIRFFDGLGPCFRFMPFLLSEAQLKTLHSVGENISEESFLQGITFFELLITIVAGKSK